MSKIVVLAPYPKGTAPSQRFRFEQYWTELEKEHELEFHAFIDEKLWKTLYQPRKHLLKVWLMLGAFFRRFRLLSTVRKADFVFIHREASQVGPPIFEWLIAKVLRKKYIYDFDDALWLPNYSEVNSSFQRLKAYWKIKYIIRWADTVTAGNEHLMAYAKKYNSNVLYLPTTIDTNYHKAETKTDADKIRIGWTGTHTTMQYLPLIEEINPLLHQQDRIIWTIISNQAPELNIPNMEFIQWKKESEIADLSTFDMGIMPLEDNEWSKGKCGFKALQYMALGIPTILSPVGTNLEIVTNGKDGLFATTAEEWAEQINKLIDDEAFRKTLAANGLKRVQEQYSTQAQWPTYQRLFLHD
ncbi:MAG: glycosyltransferase [Crocinitomicaceae bacterium]|jgi:glycosyltransferase involved in cell wall biosynthesis|nr:glycosyltransferase [Crocinitomicaceae bacterium]